MTACVCLERMFGKCGYKGNAEQRESFVAFQVPTAVGSRSAQGTTRSLYWIPGNIKVRGNGSWDIGIPTDRNTETDPSVRHAVVVRLVTSTTCTMTVPNAGSPDPDPVYIDEDTEEETKLKFNQGRTKATTFDVEYTRERLYLKFHGRYVSYKQNEDNNFKFLVLAREGTPRQVPAFLSFQTI